MAHGLIVLRGDFVRPAHRRHGVYDTMFRTRLDWCIEQQAIVVATASHNSIGTFRRYGFVVAPIANVAHDLVVLDTRDQSKGAM